ncbi:protein NRT1/ PTR FAMILY 5.4-like [Tasmannia lanceolata]|uniref:protein NRT1/ PTR FAMILY 5.4-like n=1 Tax=Tasmannia lanceolata TaxID=3420 RepID=UPI004064B9E4
MEASQASSPLLNHHEEKSQVRKPSIGGWRSAIYLIVVEVAEGFVFFGITGNLIIFLTNVYHESTVNAAKSVNLWFGIAELFPLLGAFVADSYLGRYRTIILSSLIYLLGLVTLSAGNFFGFGKLSSFISLYVIAIGQEGHKPCVQAFGADQFNIEIEQQREAKNSFFNWWYFWKCIGGATGQLIVPYIQENVGWTAGFAAPTIVMAFAFFVFLSGRNSYRQQAPSGSPFTRVAQVLVAAVCKWRLSSTKDIGDEERVSVAMDVSIGTSRLARTHQFKFLDKAAIKDKEDELSKSNWRFCSIAQIEEVKLLLRLVPIWLCCLMYVVAFSQASTFFTKQSSTMNTNISSKFKLPPASMQVTIGLVSILTVPIYDRILIPVARRITGIPSGLTTLQRIGIGIFLSVFAMVVAALVEMKRLKIATQLGPADQPNGIVPMSVLWLLPQYAIFGVANVFTLAGLLELFYDQMPDGMRSLGSAAYLSINSMGSFLNNFIISFVEEISPEWLASDLNHAHLDYYYWLLAGLSTLWLVFYMFVSKHFIYKQIYGSPP